MHTDKMKPSVFFTDKLGEISNIKEEYHFVDSTAKLTDSLPPSSFLNPPKDLAARGLCTPVFLQKQKHVQHEFERPEHYESASEIQECIPVGCVQTAR